MEAIPSILSFGSFAPDGSNTVSCTNVFSLALIKSLPPGCFCPVFRLHGDREPKQPQHGTTGGATCLSGAPNEIWCYGDECYGIMKKYLFLREKLRPYIRELMTQAHKKGTPVVRPLFLEFPGDAECWEVEDQYMFGDRYLVAPVMQKGMVKRTVYLPKGATWKRFDDGEVNNPVEVVGGKPVEVDCPLAVMPVFERLGTSSLPSRGLA